MKAIMTLEKGVATKEDIDKTLKLGMAHPMGPLELGKRKASDRSVKSAYSRVPSYLADLCVFS